MDKQTQPLSPALIEEVLAHKPQAVAELVRQAIVDQADAFSPLIQAPDFAVCLPIKGESLKRVPKPFPADHPLADHLKLKSWYLECFAQGNPAPSELADQITVLAESMRPFNEFLNRASASFTMPQR